MELTEAQIEEYAQEVITHLYGEGFVNGRTENDVNTELLKDVHANERPKIISFLTGESGLCDREIVKEANSQNRTSIFRISKLGREVMSKHGSYSNFKKHLEEMKNKKEGISIDNRGGNYVAGDMHGNQSSSQSTTNTPAKTETNIIKKISIGVFISVVSGLIIWYLTTQ